MQEQFTRTIKPERVELSNSWDRSEQHGIPFGTFKRKNEGALVIPFVKWSRLSQAYNNYFDYLPKWTSFISTESLPCLEGPGGWKTISFIPSKSRTFTDPNEKQWVQQIMEELIAKCKPQRFQKINTMQETAIYKEVVVD